MNGNPVKIRKVKRKMMSDPELKRMIIRSAWDEIMIDLDADGEPEVCISSDSAHGNINTFSIDVTGNGEFNLYLHDSEGNGIPDTILWANDDSDEMEVLSRGGRVEQGLVDVAARLEGILTAEEFHSREMIPALSDLAKYLREHVGEIAAEVERKFASAGIEKVYAFLRRTKTYYLATAEGDQPRVRPFGTVLLRNGRLYIQTGKSKRVSEQLAANPRAEICAFDNGTWLRLSGELVNDDDRAVKAAMLDDYPELKPMYSPDDGNTQVLYFRNAKAVFSSFTAPPETIEF